MAIPFANGWIQYDPDVLHPESERFFQKRVYRTDEDEIFINLYEYDMRKIVPNHPYFRDHPWSHTLDIYIPSELSPTKMAIKIENYSYTDFDPERVNENLAIVEQDAAKILFNLLGDSIPFEGWSKDFIEQH